MKLCLILFYAALSITTCGQKDTPQQTAHKSTNQQAESEPPLCDCCVFDEASQTPDFRTKLAADAAAGQRISIRGTVYQSDGTTPAADVIMYFYQTNSSGRYAKHGNEDQTSFAWWHGYIRGFVKTNHKGEYEISTIKPAPYPSRIEPAHIHCIVKAPGQKRCYYIADFVFADDELLTPAYWEATSRWWTASGIDNNPDYGGIRLSKAAGGLWEGKRDIVLLDEYNLPGIESGNAIGSESPAFSPQHVAGPDKGSHTCPMCKYGYHPGVLVFLNTDDDWENTTAICKRLEEESVKRKAQKFKAYIIYTNPKHLPVAEVERKLEQFAISLAIQNIALTYVPSIDDKATEMHLNNINPKTKTTVIVYNKRRVFDKFIDFVPSEKNFNLLFNSVEEAG